MKSVSIFKKFLIVSVLVIITVICWHIYFLASMNAEVKKEIASDEIVEKINLLVLNLSGYKNYEGDFEEQWDIQVTKINSILNQHPDLKTAVEQDFAAFTKAYEKEFQKASSNETLAAQVLFLDSNKEYVEDILFQLRSFSRQTSEDLLTFKRISSTLQVLLFIICLSLLIFYFYSFHTGYESSRILLQKALSKMETNEEIISYRKQIGNKIQGELENEVNELITGLHYKLQEREKELQEKKDFITLLVKNLPIGLAVSSLNGKEVRLTNKKYSEIYGFEPDDLDEVNSSFKAFNDKENPSSPVLSEKDLHQPKVSAKYKNQVIIDKNGISKNVAVKKIPIPGQDLLISIVKNNTKLLQKEKSLEASKIFSDVIFETNSVGLSLLDGDGCFIKINKRFCEIYGYADEELLGQHFSMLIPREEKEYFIRAFKNRSSNGSVEGTTMKEYKVVRKNGEIREVLSNSEFFASKELKGRIYTVIDITETKTEKSKMMAAIEGGGLGTWNINLETGHNEINDQWAKMLGYKKFEIPHTKEFFESLVHPEDLPSFKSSLESILRGEQTSFYHEIRLKCKNGEFKWILDSGKVIKHKADGKPVLMAGSHVDIDKVKKKELELISTGDRLRRAQEMGMVGDWELELASGGFNCSAMVCRIFGRKKSNSPIELEEVIGQFHHNSASKFREAIEKLIRDKSSISMEGDIFLPDGKIKHIRIIAVPILGLNTEVSSVMGIFQDVTSIKIAQDRLETTNKRLKLLSDNIPGGLIQFRVNGNLPPQILYLSEGAEQIWNLTREEAFRGNGEHLFINIHPKDHNFIKRSLLLASKRLERLSIIWRTLSEDGKITWHRGIGVPTKNQDTTITWNALVLDVTEIKIAENKLREQEEYMQVLTRHASDAIISCDITGKVKFVNQTLKEWVGPLDPTIEPKDWPRAYHLYSVEKDRYLKASELSLFRALETGKVYKQEFLIKRPGEPVRYVQSNGSALNDSSGNRLGAMVVLRDITQKVQQEIEISNSIIIAREKERARIASEIHDGITQSLSVVAMNMKNLRYDFSELGSSESYTRALNYLNNVIDQSRNLAHTIMPNSIKDFGLIEAVRELVEQSSSGSKKEISFEYTAYRRMPAGKELHIFRVIQEGLGNALKHSEANNIQIRLFFEEAHVRMSLEDDGKGFDARKSYHKQGIGLISMRDRVKKMKGQFRIFSGKGTVIYFKVPVKYKVEANEETSTHSYSR
ncbi:PAS domain S-box protein [Salegentibacter sp. JZCK2]|uniref:PAS domain S-box protein n=1 Tax=Salegentibacter tibetensis TaxID=2873600 RepID=UPI001CCD1687|nr:PAS domain S-box protein [Salegentibacter tibetensis]MBZ9728663.1 PAS domain S-box protein [Salegentibacter tibetensis]